MAELPNDEDFAPDINFSLKRSLLAYMEPDDYVITIHGVLVPTVRQRLAGCWDTSFR